MVPGFFFFLKMKLILLLVSIFGFLALTNGKSIEDDESKMHPPPASGYEKIKFPHPSETTQFWFTSGQDLLKSRVNQKVIEKQAKNIVFFLGDGMGVSTVTAARILKGQMAGSERGGEETQLKMETFPNLGAAKTYCTNIAISDSACTATAMLSGSKTNLATLGLTTNTNIFNCPGQMNPANHLTTILQWAQESGKSTGIVTTTAITNASPAATYAHAAFRGWETDTDIREFIFVDPDKCDDIAEQLILRNPGNKINVIMGGGRTNFRSEPTTDIETGEMNKRQDGKDLIEDWKESKKDFNAHYITHRDELLALDTENTDYLLGLFSPSSLQYNFSAIQSGDPTLTEMTEVAIKILEKNPNGYFLFVEGGKIDTAHHSNQARRALEETVEFDNAITKASEMSNEEDTLTIVTADHSHVMTFGGFADRGRPILDLTGNLYADDSKPFTSLQYANGPGYVNHVPGSGGECERPSYANDDFQSHDYRQRSGIPLGSETHGGEDVFVFAKGPFSHLLRGVYEQNYIAHVMGYAGCVGPFERYCDSQEKSISINFKSNFLTIVILILMSKILF